MSHLCVLVLSFRARLLQRMHKRHACDALKTACKPVYAVYADKHGLPRLCTVPRAVQAKQYGPGVSGALFGAGWWFWLDAIGSASVKIPFKQVRPFDSTAGAA